MRHFYLMTLATLTLLSARPVLAEDSAEKNAAAAATTSTTSDNAAACDDIADTKPAYDNRTHKFKGCRVTSVKTGSGYDKLGLKTGDLVEPGSGKAHSMQDVNKAESGH